MVPIAFSVFARPFDTEPRRLLGHGGSSVSKEASPVISPNFQQSNRAGLRRERVPSQQQNSTPLTSAQYSSTAESLSNSRRYSPSPNIPVNLEAPEISEVECFDPYSPTLKPAPVEDCQVVINEIILRYPNPFTPQTFGYTRSVDIDLSLDENRKWNHGRCVIFVRNLYKTRVDRFRIVDVATNAHRIIEQCIVGTKYSVGGTAKIGTNSFYVAVGGLTSLEFENDTMLYLPSKD